MNAINLVLHTILFILAVTEKTVMKFLLEYLFLLELPLVHFSSLL